MNILISSAVMSAILWSPVANAWTNTTSGPGPQQIVDGGPGAQATSKSKARATSNSRSEATGGQANASVTNNVGGGGSGGGGGGGGLGITVPEGLGMANCGGGIGLGGLGLGGGGSGGGTLFEFGDCKRMREISVLLALGYRQAAVNELCQIDRVKDAFGGTCPTEPQPTAIEANRRWGPDYCLTRNAGDANQHLECDQKGMLLPAR